MASEIVDIQRKVEIYEVNCSDDGPPHRIGLWDRESDPHVINLRKKYHVSMEDDPDLHPALRYELYPLDHQDNEEEIIALELGDIPPKCMSWIDRIMDSDINDIGDEMASNITSHAINDGQPDIIRLLHDIYHEGFDLCFNVYCDALRRAVGLVKFDIVKFLIGKADTNYEFGRPLTLAVMTRNIEMINLLIENGASVNASPEILYRAITEQRTSPTTWSPPDEHIINTIISSGFDFDIVSKNNIYLEHEKLNMAKEWLRKNGKKYGYEKEV